MKIQTVIQKLKAAGIIPARIEFGADGTDSAIYLSEKLHLQVGYDYLCLVEQKSEEEFEYLSSFDVKPSEVIELTIKVVKNAIDSTKQIS